MRVDCSASARARLERESEYVGRRQDVRHTGSIYLAEFHAPAAGWQIGADGLAVEAPMRWKIGMTSRPTPFYRVAAYGLTRVALVAWTQVPYAPLSRYQSTARAETDVSDALKPWAVYLSEASARKMVRTEWSDGPRDAIVDAFKAGVEKFRSGVEADLRTRLARVEAELRAQIGSVEADLALYAP